MTADELRDQARGLRERLDAMKRQYHAGTETYDALIAVAREYCAACYSWQVARFGKGRRLDPRAVIR